MQRYLKLALPLMVVTGVLTLGVNALLGLVLTIHMFDPTARLPMIYFEFLKMPALSLVLPILAAIALVPVCLRLALGGTVTMPTFVLAEPNVHQHPAEAAEIVEKAPATVGLKTKTQQETSNHHLPVAA